MSWRYHSGQLINLARYDRIRIARNEYTAGWSIVAERQISLPGGTSHEFKQVISNAFITREDAKKELHNIELFLHHGVRRTKDILFIIGT